MNFFKYYLIAGVLLFPLVLRSQISNVQVSVSPENEQIILITYDYTVQDVSFDFVIVNYTYETDNGTEVREARLVTGDVNITPGKGKRIEWDPYGEMPDFSSEKLREIKLTPQRDGEPERRCKASLDLANKYFAEGKSYKKAAFYYQEMLDCPGCNCNPKDIAYATKQLRISKIKDTIQNAKDRYHISYLSDMATAEGGGSMKGISAILLRNGGVGYYASFRSDKNFYSSQGNMSYYENETLKDNYQLTPSGDQRISSWLFSTGLTHQLIRSEHVSGYLFEGVGLGANSIAKNYSVTERGKTDNFWITDGVQNLFFSPEIGMMANIYEYLSVMAGIKYPISLTTNSALKMKGLSAMVGIGIKLKSIPKNGYTRANSYVAYTIDLPDKSGPDKLQSINLIGISTGTLSYNKVGAYVSARINPLLFNPKTESELGDNPIYTGVYDYANAFGTLGLTWMYFYGGIGVSYQKEYKEYENAAGGEPIWNSERSKVGLCTEFGLNLRLFDKLLLRIGATFPDFNLSSKDNIFSMGSNKTYLSLGLGYVLSVK